MNLQEKKIVLAHDSFTQLGGAEKVVGVLHEIFPGAPVYAVVFDKKLEEKYKDWNIRVSWLQKIYNAYPHFQYLLPLIPWAVGSIDIKEGALLLSSSSGFIKAIHKPANSVHINYCHTSTRFLWSDFDYIQQEVPLLLRPFATVFLKWMKGWDYKAAQRIDFFIANSKEVQKRIKQYYNRDSVVIYPPIDTEFWKVAGTPQKQPYFLLAGRLQAHKKNDLIIEIFNELGLPLHVVGTGRQEAYLKSIAKPNITFYGRVSDEDLREQYTHAQGFIYPQIEDAGLMPLEAASCGTATIGIAKGGSLETIIPGITGDLFEDYDKEKIKKIITQWQANKYQVDKLQAHAEKFSKEKFKKQIIDNVNLFL
jgi:glycosyltransferase involved in cell wall biosynthesis